MALRTHIAAGVPFVGDGSPRAQKKSLKRAARPIEREMCFEARARGPQLTDKG